MPPCFDIIVCDQKFDDSLQFSSNLPTISTGAAIHSAISIVVSSVRDDRSQSEVYNGQLGSLAGGNSNNLIHLSGIGSLGMNIDAGAGGSGLDHTSMKQKHLEVVANIQNHEVNHDHKKVVDLQNHVKNVKHQMIEPSRR